MLNRLAKVVAVAVLVWPLVAFPGCPRVKDTTKLPKEKVLPLKTATLEELAARLEEQAAAVESINAEAEMTPTTGSAYSGVIEEYHDARAFLLAERGSEERIRVIGQAPIVRKTVFDMVADEREFRIFLPTKNKFIVGPAKLERRSEKPIENLRPQHLLEALFPPAPWAGTPLLLEENEFGGRRYYAVSEVVLDDAGGLRLHRKWWFERSGLELERVQRFGPQGELVADIHYADWREAAGVRYPHQIELVRPHDDYRLRLRLKKLTLNEPLEAEKFRLEKPEGAELVEAKEKPEEPPQP